MPSRDEKKQEDRVLLLQYQSCINGTKGYGKGAAEGHWSLPQTELAKGNVVGDEHQSKTYQSFTHWINDDTSNSRRGQKAIPSLARVNRNPSRKQPLPLFPPYLPPPLPPSLPSSSSSQVITSHSRSQVKPDVAKALSLEKRPGAGEVQLIPSSRGTVEEDITVIETRRETNCKSRVSRTDNGVELVRTKHIQAKSVGLNKKPPEKRKHEEVDMKRLSDRREPSEKRGKSGKEETSKRKDIVSKSSDSRGHRSKSRAAISHTSSSGSRSHRKRERSRSVEGKSREERRHDERQERTWVPSMSRNWLSNEDFPERESWTKREPLFKGHHKFPFNYLNFVETLLSWDFKCSVDLDLSVDIAPNIPEPFLYPYFLKIAKKARCFDVYYQYDQVRFAYIPCLLLEAIKFLRQSHETYSPAVATNTTNLCLKGFKEMEDNCHLQRVKTEIQREGSKPRFLSGDVIFLDFGERDKKQHLAIIASVASSEDFEKKTMSGSLLHVIDEYVIYVGTCLRRHLKSLSGEQREFEASVLCNIQSLLFQVDSVYKLKKSRFQKDFLFPKPIDSHIERPSLELNPQLFRRTVIEAIELGVGFVSHINARRSPSERYDKASGNIVCLTSGNDLERVKVAHEIVSNSILTKSSVKLLLVTQEDKLNEWTAYLQFFNVNFYTIGRQFNPVQEYLKAMDKSERKRLLSEEFFRFTHQVPKPNAREKVLNEIDAWLHGNQEAAVISPYTSLNLDLYLDSKRKEIIKNATVTIGSYEEIMSDRNFMALLRKHMITFDCCLVDEGHFLSEFRVVSLLNYPFDRLLLIGSDLPLGQGRKSLLERFVTQCADFAF